MRIPISNVRGITKISVVAAAGLLGLSMSTSSVLATLQAETHNTTPQAITSGTLKIEHLKNGNGFTTTIADMAPGDVVNRYVDYTNSGSLDSKALRLKVAGTGSTLLTTDATRGLQLVVTDCTGGTWAPTTGVCSSGTTTTLLTSPVASLGSDMPFSGTTTLNAGAAMHLQFKVSLPNGGGINDETTVNGALPANTIQGLSTSITWTLSETQRDGVTTNS